MLMRNNLFLVTAFIAGWFVHVWYSDSIQLAINHIADKTKETIELSAAQSARILENKLQELRANEKTIEQHYQTEIVKPVFSNICVSDEFISMYNQASDNIERTLSGKFINAMPDSITKINE